MTGTWRKVLRLVPAVAVVVLVAVGCGGAARPHHSIPRGVPRTLAQDWEGQASAIAAAAAAGDDCRALQLATALRGDVTTAQSRVPSRLRRPLVHSVTELADRLTCTPPPPTTQASPKKPKPPPKPPHKEHGHHHDHHGHGGDNGDQG